MWFQAFEFDDIERAVGTAITATGQRRKTCSPQWKTACDC